MKISAEIPMTNRAYKGFSPDSIPDRLRQYSNMKAKYGTVIDQSIRMNNIPDALLYGILMIENPDAKADVVNSISATGLGQFIPSSALDILNLAQRRGVLTPEKKAVLRKVMGSRLDVVTSWKNSDTIQDSMPKSEIQRYLKDAEFCVMLVGIELSMLVTEESKSGSLRADYVAVRYNQSFYLTLGKAARVPKNLSTDGLLSANIRPEGKNYILKMVGKNGWLELLNQ